MRHLLLRFLLLALCFHTVVGRPAHEASHFVQAIERAAAQPSAQAALENGFERDEVEDVVQGGKGGAGVDGLCAWCLAFAHSAHFAAVPDDAWSPPSRLAAGQPGPALAIGCLAGLDRWRFSARDPPEATPRG